MFPLENLRGDATKYFKTIFRIELPHFSFWDPYPHPLPGGSCRRIRDARSYGVTALAGVIPTQKRQQVLRPVGVQERFTCTILYDIILAHVNVLRCVEFKVAQGVTVHMPDPVERIM